MAEQDFSKRMILVIRKDLAGWQIANTVAHISAYIGNKLGAAFSTGEFFVSADKADFPRNSQYPIVIKRANSSEQLHTVLSRAREQGIMHHAFIREMIDTSDDSEIETILENKSAADIELLGVGVFGKNEAVNHLTKKFGLWE